MADAAPRLEESVFGPIARRAGEADATGDLEPDVARLAAAGFLAAPLPRDAGGRGLGTSQEGALSALALLRRLGRANLSLARLFEGHVNAVKLVALYAGAATRETAFRAVRDGALLGVWGADDADHPVTMVPEGDGWRLTGAKRFASGLGLVRLAIVTAARPQFEPAQLLIVAVDEAQRADADAWTASGMRATLSGRYDFEGLAVTEGELVGQPGDFLREPHFEGGTWRYAAAHLGGAEALCAEMVDRLEAAGRAAHPIQEMRIADAVRACESARLWLEAAARRVEGPVDVPENAAAYALFAREATQNACLEVIRLTEDALGTAAYDRRSPVERMRRDLGLYLRQAAPDAKRSRAVRALLAAGGRLEDL